MRATIITIILLFIVIITYISLVSLHEVGHIIIFKNQGIEIGEFVILGYTDGNLLKEQYAFGWVRPMSEYNKTPHECWDEMWKLNFTCWGMKL